MSTDDEADPEREALLADSVGLALLAVLETLTPAERLAFVLHDMFALPFEEIAPIVGPTPVATRQLTSRARRVQGAYSRCGGRPHGAAKALDAFLAASRAGDFEALVAVLDPDVVFRADRGRLPAADRQPAALHGAADVAQPPAPARLPSSDSRSRRAGSSRSTSSPTPTSCAALCCPDD